MDILKDAEDYIKFLERRKKMGACMTKIFKVVVISDIEAETEEEAKEKALCAVGDNAKAYVLGHLK